MLYNIFCMVYYSTPTIRLCKIQLSPATQCHECSGSTYAHSAALQPSPINDLSRTASQTRYRSTFSTHGATLR